MPKIFPAQIIAALVAGSAMNFPTVEKPVKKTKSRRGYLTKVQPTGSVGRNDPCPCKSGLKYKKCCLPKVSAGMLPKK